MSRTGTIPATTKEAIIFERAAAKKQFNEWGNYFLKGLAERVVEDYNRHLNALSMNYKSFTQ